MIVAHRMKMVDVKCSSCGAVTVDVLLRDTASGYPVCANCGQPTERVHLGKVPGIIPDGIPGGLEITNGFCNADGTPRKFYSKSEIARAAKEAGWTNYVEHKGTKSGDRSKFTTRWI